MANYQAGDKIAHALDSVLRQSMPDLELIVSDDASGDHSLQLVRTRMAQDPRIRLIENAANRGPAHCRNQALDSVRGDWVAIVDSDDIIHPERFERLLAAADRYNADIIADDLLLFHEDGSPPRLMLGDETRGSFAVSAHDWVLAGLDGSPALGYLKPLIRAEHLQSVRYDESLRIGEDYDLILGLLLAEASMTIIAEPLYLYRRHSASISHRLSVTDMEAMLARQLALTTTHQNPSPELRRAFDKRISMLKAGLAYERLVASLKQRDVAGALGMILSDPTHIARLWASLRDRRRQRHTPIAQASPGPIVLAGQGQATPPSMPLPVYVPAALSDWSGPRPRALWRDLARHAGMPCIAMDDAGRYAAGFIPEVVLQEAQVPA